MLSAGDMYTATKLVSELDKHWGNSEWKKDNPLQVFIDAQTHDDFDLNCLAKMVVEMICADVTLTTAVYFSTQPKVSQYMRNGKYDHRVFLN